MIHLAIIQLYDFFVQSIIYGKGNVFYLVFGLIYEHFSAKIVVFKRWGDIMQQKAIPQIRPLTDLKTRTNEMATIVDMEKSPVIFTRHGYGKYIFMSLAEYNIMVSRYALYDHLQEGLDDIASGRTAPFGAFMDDLRKELIP